MIQFRTVEASALIAGILLIAIVLWDAFETIILSRRVSRKLRLTRLFYWLTWRPWRALGLRMRPGNPRENYLSVYGPLSLILLLVLWAVGLIFGFALIDWGERARLAAPTGTTGFSADLYMSGTTFFTLGYGDVTPLTAVGRVLAVIEAGTGFGFLALVIGYLPTLSQAFSRREVNIALLDARAGSPPTAAELLRRHAGDPAALGQLLAEWERWSAQLLESHVSFPVLAYYRSQHDNQSWVAGLTTILDTCSLVIAAMHGPVVGSARLTFAMARHAIVDLARIFSPQPRALETDRLAPPELARLCEALTSAGIPMRESEETDRRLAELRAMYEPYATGLSSHLIMPLPSWVPPAGAPADNWQRTA
jgi:hypothetical protein